MRCKNATEYIYIIDIQWGSNISFNNEKLDISHSAPCVLGIICDYSV